MLVLELDLSGSVSEYFGPWRSLSWRLGCKGLAAEEMAISIPHTFDRFLAHRTGANKRRTVVVDRMMHATIERIFDQGDRRVSRRLILRILKIDRRPSPSVENSSVYIHAIAQWTDSNQRNLSRRDRGRLRTSSDAYMDVSVSRYQQHTQPSSMYI